MIWEQVDGKWTSVIDAYASRTARLAGADFAARKMAFVAALQTHCGLRRFEAERQVGQWITELS